MAALKKHWRYLIARYGAYPVIWCAAGEALIARELDALDDDTGVAKLKERLARIEGTSDRDLYL